MLPFAIPVAASFDPLTDNAKAAVDVCSYVCTGDVCVIMTLPREQEILRGILISFAFALFPDTEISPARQDSAIMEARNVTKFLYSSNNIAWFLLLVNSDCKSRSNSL